MPLLGRSSECARVERLLTEARAGRGGALLVRGPPGIGKTALLRYARERAAGMRVLAAAGVESETELPFAGLVTLLRPLRDLVPELPDSQRDALANALALGPGARTDRFTVSLATLNLLAAAADREPILCLVDDAQCLDRSSVEALLFAARRLGDDPVAILLAARDADDDRAGIVRHGLPELRLDGLAREECARLLEELVPGRLPSTTIDRIVETTGGNPLAVVEIASAASEEDLAAGRVPAEPLAVGPQISRAFSRRVTSLPPPAQRAAGLAAVSETGAASEIAAVLRRLGLSMEALYPAEDAGLVAIEGGRVSFAHPLLRGVAYQSLSPPDRRIAHLALAEVLAEEKSLMRRAWHLAAAVVEPDETVARVLETAADEARERGAPGVAGEALETAARLTPADSDRVRRLLLAAGEFHLGGLRDRAIRVLDAALAAQDDRRVRADIAHMRLRVGLLCSACVATRHRLVEEAERIKGLDPERAASMLVDASIVSVMEGQPRRALRLARRAYSTGSQGDGLLGAIASHTLGIALLLRGDPAAAAPHLARGTALTDVNNLLALGHHAIHAAQTHSWREGHAHARDDLRALVARLRAESALTLLPYALAALAEAEFHLGHWDAAYANASESVDLADEIGQPNELSHSLVRLAHVEAGQGREAACREHLRRALEIAMALDVGSIRTLHGTTLGLLELGLGRLGEAIAVLEETRRLAIRSGLREPRVAMWAADLAEAYARAGRADDAVAQLEFLERHGRTAGRSSELAAAARVRGLLAADDSYAGVFAQALEWHEPIQLPFEHARTQLCFGERLRRAGAEAEARSELRAALSTFEHLAAAPWARRARAELAATGETPRTRHDPTSELTPQELQVALLVADGATNREAAAALFVSPKTIEVHLTRVYRKLGLRSRTELARRLADAGVSGGSGGGRFTRDIRAADVLSERWRER